MNHSIYVWSKRGGVDSVNTPNGLELCAWEEPRVNQTPNKLFMWEPSGSYTILWAAYSTCICDSVSLSIYLHSTLSTCTTHTHTPFFFFLEKNGKSIQKFHLSSNIHLHSLLVLPLKKNTVYKLLDLPALSSSFKLSVLIKFSNTTWFLCHRTCTSYLAYYSIIENTSITKSNIWISQ